MYVSVHVCEITDSGSVLVCVVVVVNVDLQRRTLLVPTVFKAVLMQAFNLKDSFRVSIGPSVQKATHRNAKS